MKAYLLLPLNKYGVYTPHDIDTEGVIDLPEHLTPTNLNQCTLYSNVDFILNFHQTAYNLK